MPSVLWFVKGFAGTAVYQEDSVDFLEYQVVTNFVIARSTWEDFGNKLSGKVRKNAFLAI